MKIRMLETRRGTEDGHTIQQFMKGQEYDVKSHLARSFLAAKYCELVTAIEGVAI